jgi:putative membrane protein
VTSVLFLISYLVYHYHIGSKPYPGQGAIRSVYFFILITHIVLSAAVVPMILTSLYLALSGRLITHKRVARWTFPIWLYVSVTGVLIFGLLKLFNPASG